MTGVDLVLGGDAELLSSWIGKLVRLSLLWSKKGEESQSRQFG